MTTDIDYKQLATVLEEQIEAIAAASAAFHRWLDEKPAMVSRKNVRIALTARGLGRRGHETAAESNDPEPPIPPVYLAQSIGDHKPEWASSNLLHCAADHYLWPCSEARSASAPASTAEEER
jgi:hypothetical protein